MPRDQLIDALRGFALFGILAVNIQCFVTGLSAPSLGVLDSQSSVADHLTVLLTAFLLEFKFYPIFSFCFGYGFAIQTRRWAATGVPAGPRFIRRMNGLLFMGLLHGGLLWFGDILTRYAITGYVLQRYAGYGPRRLLKAAKFWFMVAIVLMAVFSAVMVASSSADVPHENLARTQALQLESTRVFAAYSQGSYVEATIQRVNDFATVTLGFIILIPQVMVMFLLGSLAAHLGLLRRPDRYRSFWEKMMKIGLWVGIPVNIVYAWQQWQASQQPWAAAQSLLTTLAGDFAPILSVAFIAAFALHGSSGTGKTFVRVVAPAGRIALTMYVSQSALMALLLSGFGFGMGVNASPADLMLIASGIYIVLIAASHVMQHYAIPGPLEAMWRKYTYASPAAGQSRL